MKGIKGITGLSLILAMFMMVIMPGGCLLRAPTYTLTLHRNNDSWGGVSGGGTFRVGQTVRIDATSFQGYHFLNWTLEGTSISGEAVYDYTMPRENVTLVANFVIGEMVRVEGDTFEMGDEVGDLHADRNPVHQVSLTYDYWIGKYEVTFDEYDAFCDAAEKTKPHDGPSNDLNTHWGRGTRPVINVSWWDAIAYCNWLSEENGLAPAYDNEGNLLNQDGEVTQDITQVEGYRLLTEAEWEYAASGGHKALPIPPRFLYAGSDDVDEVAWSRMMADFGSQPVGQKKPNELGLYDMSGNVWEWCHDWYADYTSSAKTNPVGPSIGRSRILRGGSWHGLTRVYRVAWRIAMPPDTPITYWGFRLARTVF